jgi:hypothetical protein
MQYKAAFVGLAMLAGCAVTPQVDHCAPKTDQVAREICYQMTAMREEMRRRAFAQSLEQAASNAQTNWTNTQNAIINAPLPQYPSY